MHSSRRFRLVAALTASVSFSLAVIALAFAISGLAGDNARVWMERWEKDGKVGGDWQWEQACSRLLLARRLNPLKADYHADFGHLMAWGAWSRFPDRDGCAGGRPGAELAYAKSIDARPGWGYAWASFAENRLLQGKSDAPFLHALEMSIVLAPWEPWVQKKVAWMGMATWNDLPAHLQQLVLESIERTVALGHFPYEIVRLAVQYDWLDRLRPMLQTVRQVQAMEFVLKQLDAQW